MTDEEKNPTGGANQGPDDGVEFGEGKGPAQADSAGDPQAGPDAGGFAGRDPKTEMPRIPTVPETQEGDQSHGGEPPQDSEPPASN